MIQLKPGVDLRGMCPEILLAITVAHEVFARFSVDLTVTSCVDGRHSKASLHYVGRAVDFRTRTLTPPEVVDCCARLRTALGGPRSQYDVVAEADHLHVEFQPKARP